MPDLTNVQVQVITEAPALIPLEVESLLSFPVEGAMSGLPNVEQIRSISKFGISVVTIVFQEGTDIYRARQLVGERLPRRRRGHSPGLRHARAWARSPRRWARSTSSRSRPRKESGVTPMELRTLLDWYIAYQLRKVPGVTEINSHGGELKTYQVEVDPDKLGDLSPVDDRRVQRPRTTTPTSAEAISIHEGEARYIRGESRAHGRSRTSRRSSSTSGTACRSRSARWPGFTPRR